MNKVCKKCGHENPSDANFCGGCGATIEKDAAEVYSTDTCWGRFCAFGRTYLLKFLMLLVCFIVFISGFFTAIRYTPQEDMQSSLLFYSGDIDDIDDIVIGPDVEQNVFNVIPALFVGTDPAENQEELEEITEKITVKIENIVKKYEDEITELTLLASQGNARAQSKLVKLIKQIVNEVADGLENVNLIKADALESEIAFSYYSEVGDSNLSENGYRALKAAQDLDIRTAVMVGYPIGYIYLQVISLIFLIITMVSIFNKKAERGLGKFFIFYLTGFIFMFAIGQLTACSLNGVGMFCFIFALVIGVLYLAGKLMFGNILKVKDIATLACKGIALVFTFVAVALLLNNYIIFNSVISKIGSVFGLHCYDSYSFTSQEQITSYTLVNFLPAAILYLATISLALAAFFHTTKYFLNFRKKEKGLLPLVCVSAGFGLLSYLVLVLLGLTGVTDSLMHGDAFVSAVFSIATIFFILLGKLFNKYLAKEKAPDNHISAPAPIVEQPEALNEEAAVTDNAPQSEA